MAKYLLVYHGGGPMEEDAAAQAAVMEAWGAWFGQLGAAVVDGGNPVDVRLEPDGGRGLRSRAIRVQL